MANNQELMTTDDSYCEIQGNIKGVSRVSS